MAVARNAPEGGQKQHQNVPEEGEMSAAAALFEKEKGRKRAGKKWWRLQRQTETKYSYEM